MEFFRDPPKPQPVPIKDPNRPLGLSVTLLLFVLTIAPAPVVFASRGLEPIRWRPKQADACRIVHRAADVMVSCQDWKW